MFCPKCGYEYREEFTMCSDCNVQLVEKSEIKRHSTGGLNLTKTFKSGTSIICKKLTSCLNSIKFIRISNISYKLLLLSLIIFNFLTIRYISLWIIGPGWEIPVDLVGPIKLTSGCALISLLFCIVLYGIGYIKFRLQPLTSKTILILWLLGSIILFLLSSHFRDLSEQYINLIVSYWWMGLFLPLTLFSVLIYKDNIFK